MFLTLFCDVHGAARSPQYAWWIFDAIIKKKQSIRKRETE